MSKTLSKFKEKITQDKLLQTTYYKVSFTGVPVGVADIDGNGADAFDIYCQATDLPGKKLDVLEVKKRGFTLRMPGNVSYEGTWKVSVLVNLNLTHYKKLLKWQSFYSDVAKGMGGARGFSPANGVITLLDNNFNENSQAGKLVIYGIFPSEVPALSMKQDVSEYITSDVTFTYSYTSDYNGFDPMA